MKNELLVYLAILGGLFLAGVVIHGAWQARRAGPKVAAGEGEEGRQAPRDPQEPTFDDGRADAIRQQDAPGVPERAEPVLHVPRKAEPRLDPLIDALAAIQLEGVVSGDALLAHLPPSRRVGSKPMGVEGLNAGSGQWESIQPGARYSQLQIGVQMANRHGPINEIEFSEFAHKVQALADSVGGMADVPDMLDVVHRGRELDAFSSAHDVHLAIHLRAKSAAWSLGYIQQHASRHGFVAGVLPGRMVLPSQEEGAPPVLSLTFDAQAALAEEPSQQAVRDVTLSFDVPQTDPQAEPFAAWQASAIALSMGMDAAIVDDVGQPLSEASFYAIGGELGQVYQALAARDLAAGSHAARRLFS
jgi:hypothetical protein